MHESKSHIVCFLFLLFPFPRWSSLSCAATFSSFRLGLSVLTSRSGSHISQRVWLDVTAPIMHCEGTGTWFGRSPGYAVRRILAPSFPVDLNLLCLSARLRPLPWRFPPAVHRLINGFITSPSPCVIVISPLPPLYVYFAHILASAVTSNSLLKNQAAKPGKRTSYAVWCCGVRELAAHRSCRLV